MSPFQPSNKEEEYFLKKEAEKLQKAIQEEKAKMAKEEQERLKELHYMRCPKCGMELKEIVFKDIHIDECFSCGGVWLDAGELELVAQSDKDGIAAKISALFKPNK